MLAPTERKKLTFSLRPSHNSEMKKYEEVYMTFANTGYTTELCEQYADTFIDNNKKPNPIDIIQLSSLYMKIHDYKNSAFYLDMLSERKLSGMEKLDYCIQMLKTISLIGNWREAVAFRTENINFLQKYMEKVDIKKQADIYIALALADCSAKNYDQALKLLKFGYKPHGKNDLTLLEIFITVLYIFAKAQDSEGVEGALANANSCLNIFHNFDFSWCKSYFQQRINDAAAGIF